MPKRQGSGRWCCVRAVKLLYSSFVLRTDVSRLQCITVLIAPRLLMPRKLHLAMASYADILQWPFFPLFSSTWTLLSCSGLVIQRFLLRRQILLCLKSPAEPGCPIKQLFAPHFLLFLSIFSCIIPSYLL